MARNHVTRFNFVVKYGRRSTPDYFRNALPNDIVDLVANAGVAGGKGFVGKLLMALFGLVDEFRQVLLRPHFGNLGMLIFKDMLIYIIEGVVVFGAAVVVLIAKSSDLVLVFWSYALTAVEHDR